MQIGNSVGGRNGSMNSKKKKVKGMRTLCSIPFVNKKKNDLKEK